MSAVSFSVNISRPLLLERGLLATLLCSLIADYCGGNLPFTDAWVFFCLIALSQGAQRLVSIGFVFGALTVFTDIFFLSLVSALLVLDIYKHLGRFLAAPAPGGIHLTTPADFVFPLILSVSFPLSLLTPGMAFNRFPVLPHPMLSAPLSVSALSFWHCCTLAPLLALSGVFNPHFPPSFLPPTPPSSLTH